MIQVLSFKLDYIAFFHVLIPVEGHMEWFYFVRCGFQTQSSDLEILNMHVMNISMLTETSLMICMC